MKKTLLPLRLIWIRASTAGVWRRFNQRHYARAAAITSVFILLFALSKQAFAADEPILIAVSRNALNLPLYVAESENLFAKQGVIVKFVDCTGGQQCLRMLTDGKVQMATSAETPVMFAGLQGDAISIIATINTTRRNNSIVVRKSSGITGVEGLAGRKIGVPIGSAAHYYLDALCLLAGTDPRALKLVPIKPDEAPAKLRAGEVDAVAIFEPWTFNTMQALKGDASLLANPRVYKQNWNLVVSNKLIERREREMDAVLRALEDAIKRIEKSPDYARRLLTARLALSDATIDWIWPHLTYELVLEQSLLTELEGQARWAIANGHAGTTTTKSTPNFLPYIHPAPMMRVHPDGVTLSK